MIFIGVPGGLLWVTGMVTFVFSCGAFWDSDSDRLPAIIAMGVSTIFTAIGFAMVACTEMLNGAKRYRMPRGRLPAYLGLELLEGLLAVAVVVITLATFDAFMDKEFGAGMLWAIFNALMVFLLVTNHRAIRLKGRIWRSEVISS